MNFYINLSHFQILAWLALATIATSCLEGPSSDQVEAKESMSDLASPEPQKNEVIKRESEKLGITDWNVTQAIWGEKDNRNDTFKADVVLFYNTIFPNNIDKMVFISPSDKADEKSRQEFLKRLFIFLAYAPLKVTNKKNDITGLREWPYPLAVSLAHGGRVLLEVSDVPLNKSLYNLLLSGAWETVSDKDIIRRAASHGIIKVDGRFHEIRLGFLQSLKNIKLGLQGAHRGYNIAFGGLGNPDLSGLIIGPRGTRFKNNQKVVNIQHGHIYMQSARSLQPSYDVVLLGIEKSAPGKQSATGQIHNKNSAFINSSLEPSVTGGKKMKYIIAPEEGGPAVEGGLRATMTYSQAQEAMKIYEKINKLDVTAQQDLFKELLSGSSTQGKQILSAY